MRKPAKGTDPKSVVVIGEDRGDIIISKAVRVLSSMQKMRDASRGWVEAIQSLAQCACPHHVVRIDIYIHEQVVGKAVGILGIMMVMLEGSSGWVEMVQSTAPGGDPNASTFIFGKCADGVGTEAGRVARIVPIQTELSGIGWQFIDSAVRCANPQNAGAVSK